MEALTQKREVEMDEAPLVLRSLMDSPCGLRFIFDSLNIYSGYARRRLLEREMYLCKEEIADAYSKLREFYKLFFEEGANRALADGIRAKFCDLKEISGTLGRLASGAVLDDIELFEIKALILLSQEVGGLASAAGLKVLEQENLDKELEILDPDALKIRAFYIYDAYSKELAALRVRLRSADEERRQELELKERELEFEVRKRLCALLRPSAERLRSNMERLADMDILFAQAEQMREMHLVLPIISDSGKSCYKGLFHPQVKSIKGDEFVPVDIEFDHKPVIITGANMGGKTVTLMMCALAQYLFQFGFGIPAESACIAPVERVFVTMGDGQSMEGGFSSFAAEMLSVNSVIKAAQRGCRLLALIDEPARTTNPVEGRALVEGMLELLSGYSISLVISTHYNVSSGDYKWLRVAGFKNGKMDYRLIEATKGDVPHEAVRIAEELGVDAGWIAAAERHLELELE